jgi:hypothetical protein
MTPEIWQDIATRIHNLHGDVVGQWQGDLDNATIGNTASMLGTVRAMWEGAKPIEPPPAVPAP